MDMTPLGVATIGGDAEVDHAIATLVLAFVTDPVARWMYDDPHQYLLHIPRLFRALGKNSFEGGAAQRTNDGLGVALWLPPGVHGDDGPLEAVIAESITEEKQAEVAALFEQTEDYRPTEPHWYLSLIGVEALHRNKGCGAALLEHRLRHCDREHLSAYLYQRHGFEIAGMIRVGSSPSIYPMLRSALKNQHTRVAAGPLSCKEHCNGHQSSVFDDAIWRLPPSDFPRLAVACRSAELDVRRISTRAEASKWSIAIISIEAASISIEAARSV